MWLSATQNLPEAGYNFANSTLSTQLQRGSTEDLLKTTESTKLQTNTSRSEARRPRAPPPAGAPAPDALPQQPPAAPGRPAGVAAPGRGRAGGGEMSIAAWRATK